MNDYVDYNVAEFVQMLVGKSLYYCLKSPDTELYDLGFLDNNCKTKEVTECDELALHAICCFKLIIPNSSCRSILFDAETSRNQVNSQFKSLIGLPIKRIALSEKNDLWLDFGNYWLVFITSEDGEESWRLFDPNSDAPHLVATDTWIGF